MGKHQFSGLIKCGGCGEMVGMVEAISWREAAAGRGLCAECEKANHEPHEKHEREEAEQEHPAEPVYVGQAYDVPEVVVEVVETEPPRKGSRRPKEAVRSTYGKAGAV